MTDYLAKNRELWTKVNAEYTDRVAEQKWASEEITWGLSNARESELGVLGDVAGKDVIELGCGTAYVGAWLARRGARVTGVDITPAQLDTARRCCERFDLELELVEANAEDVPLPDASFDLAVSEYGASIWCDPYRWVPEAARLLRPGGELVFLRNSTLLMLCTPVDGEPEERLVRPQFGLHRLEWPDDRSVEFHLPHGEWIRLLRGSGFEIEGLWELHATEATGDQEYYPFSVDWARKWPAEEIWKARKPA